MRFQNSGGFHAISFQALGTKLLVKIHHNLGACIQNGQREDSECGAYKDHSLRPEPSHDNCSYREELKDCLWHTKPQAMTFYGEGTTRAFSDPVAPSSRTHIEVHDV